MNNPILVTIFTKGNILIFPCYQIGKYCSIEGIIHVVLLSIKFSGDLKYPPPLALIHEDYICMCALICVATLYGN